ncbi:MAG: integrase [Flavobacterium sp. BFFFF2]|nr:MAG: integrase [Flavobacterium sp. BFFFF2]
MTLKNTKATTSYIEWDDFKSLVSKLERDGEYKFCLLITIGVFTALRISDLLKLRYIDILNKDVLIVVEQKTKKTRSIKINPDMHAIVSRVVKKTNIHDLNELIFLNRFGTKAIDKSYVNVKLKVLFKTYNIRVNGNVSSHTFRKSFGRKLLQANNFSNQYLILLSELFGHSSPSITRTYLGIREKEIHDLYTSISL